MNGTLSGIVAILMWPLMPLMVYYSGDMPAFLLGGISFFISFLFFSFYQVYKKENIKSYWTQPLGHYAFVMLGVGGYTLLLYAAFKMIPAFEATALNYLWPIFLVVFAGIVHKQKLKLNGFLGSILSFLGVVSLFFPHNGQAFFENFSFGYLIAIAAPIIWATYSLMTRNKDFPQGMMAPVFLFISIICFVCHLFFEQAVWSYGFLPWLAVIALGVTRVSYSFWDYGMKHGNVVLLASLSYFIPLLSTGLLVLFATRPENGYIALGGGLIVLGCLIVNADKIIAAVKKKK